MDINEYIEQELSDTFAPSKNLESEKFTELYKCHDWRNYVPDEFRDNWQDLTERERKIIVTLCNQRADIEEWD